MFRTLFMFRKGGYLIICIQIRPTFSINITLISDFNKARHSNTAIYMSLNSRKFEMIEIYIYLVLKSVLPNSTTNDILFPLITLNNILVCIEHFLVINHKESWMEASYLNFRRGSFRELRFSLLSVNYSFPSQRLVLYIELTSLCGVDLFLVEEIDRRGNIHMDESKTFLLVNEITLLITCRKSPTVRYRIVFLEFLFPSSYNYCFLLKFHHAVSLH